MNYDHLDVQTVLDRVDALRAEIDAERPVDADALGRAMQRLRLEWTYHSNAIEGNSLTYGETMALLMHGVTAQGKPLKDHLDIERHGEVIDYVQDFVRSDEPVTIDFIKEIHFRLMGEEYKVRAETPDGDLVWRTVRGGDYKQTVNNVKTRTGEIHYYALPAEVPGRMAEIVEWLQSEEAESFHPVIKAALFQHRFVEIHPFPDGNGRTSRMLMNLLLIRAGYIPVVIRQENRDGYYGALAQADSGDDQRIIEFVADELVVTMRLYLRALRGEPDPTVFDKRLMLLERRAISLAKPDQIARSEEAIAAVSSRYMAPYFARMKTGMDSMLRLFNEVDLSAVATMMDGRKRNIKIGFPMSIIRDPWIGFQGHWLLKGYKKSPGEEMSANFKCQAGDHEIVLTRGGLGVKSLPPIRLSYSGDEGEEIAQRDASKHLEAILDAVETIQKKVEAQQAS